MTFVAILELLGGIRAAIFAGLLALALAAGSVQTWRVAILKNNVATLEQEAAALVLAQELALATRDLEHRETVEKLRDSYAKETELANTRRDKLIADLNAGNKRLLDRFRCPSSGAASTTASSGSNGASGGGLLDSDAEFLVREAARADEVVRRLTMAQGIIASCTEEPK